MPFHSKIFRYIEINIIFYFYFAIHYAYTHASVTNCRNETAIYNNKVSRNYHVYPCNVPKSTPLKFIIMYKPFYGMEMEFVAAQAVKHNGLSLLQI